jgi:hypothetical protein
VLTIAVPDDGSAAKLRPGHFHGRRNDSGAACT